MISFRSFVVVAFISGSAWADDAPDAQPEVKPDPSKSGGEKIPLFQERLRPRYHFTAEQGYINDPNGLFFLDGTFHLFFQRKGIREKVWGHATSKDFFYWEQHDDAITMINKKPVFSGSAAIDYQNTTGFGSADNPPVVACFTEWGVGQSLAYSTDRGESWQRYEGNPVLKRPGDERANFTFSSRDPHIMWDEERSRWVLVMYDNIRQEKRNGPGTHRKGFSIFTSPDLKDWTYQSHLDDFYVCPDLVQLSLDGGKEKRWVAMDWERYTVGDFDGESFSPKEEILPLDLGGKEVLSANQSWKYLPDGRSVQISWIRHGKFPKMPFTQQLSVPVELSLRTIEGRPRLCKWPVAELETKVPRTEVAVEKTDKGAVLSDLGLSFDLVIEPDFSTSEEVEVTVLGEVMVLKEGSLTMRGKVVEIPQGVRKVRILGDVTSLEIFLNQGENTLTWNVVPKAGDEAGKVEGSWTALVATKLGRTMLAPGERK